MSQCTCNCGNAKIGELEAVVERLQAEVRLLRDASAGLDLFTRAAPPQRRRPFQAPRQARRFTVITGGAA